MKVLVTGGTGFLGKNLAYKLKKAGFDVSVLGRNKITCGIMKQDGFRVIRTDLRNINDTIDCASGHEIVFHCAALSSPWGKYRDFYQSNVVGTENIIKSCVKHGVKKLIHVSTPSIYFEFKDKKNILESEPLPLKQVNHYAKTKFLAERKIDEAWKRGLPVVTIRPRGIFGPGDTAIIPRLMKAHDKMALPLFREGRILVDMTYVDNVSDALIACIDAPKSAVGKKINITNGQPMYLIDLLKLLFDKLGKELKTKSVSFQKAYCAASLLELLYKAPFVKKEPPLTKYAVGLLAFDQTLNIESAQDVLAYKPKISIEEGLELFISSLRASA